MSDTGRDTNLIADDVQANYRAIRLDAGRTWVEQAEEFERQAEAAHGDRSLYRLAAWARSEAALAGEVDGPAEREGTTPGQPERGRPGKRTTKAEPAPHRTDSPTADASAVDVDVVEQGDTGLPIAV